MARLPVSGAEVALREPNGADDMVLHEAAGTPVEIGLALLARLAGEGDWAALTVTDYEALLLALHTARFGQDLALGFACPACRERVEITIRVDDFLAGVRPRAAPGVAPDPARPGWYRLADAGFRLPTAGDQAAVATAGTSQPPAPPAISEAARRMLLADITDRGSRAWSAIAAAAANQPSGRMTGNVPSVNAPVGNAPASNGTGPGGTIGPTAPAPAAPTDAISLALDAVQQIALAAELSARHPGTAGGARQRQRREPRGGRPQSSRQASASRSSSRRARSSARC